MRWRRRAAEPEYVSFSDWIQRGTAMLSSDGATDPAGADEVVAGLEAALARLPRSHPRRDLGTQVLLHLLARRYDRDASDDDLQRMDDLLPADLSRRPTNAPPWAVVALLTAEAHHARWSVHEDVEDLDRSMDLLEPAIADGEDASAVRYLLRAESKFLMFDDESRLDRALEREERLLGEGSRLGQPERELARAIVASARIQRATHGPSADGGADLDRALVLLQDVDLGDDSAAGRYARSVLSLGARCRWVRDGRREDVDLAVEACTGRTDPAGLVHLSLAVLARYDHDLKPADLAEALALARSALTAFEDGEPAEGDGDAGAARRRSHAESALADALRARFWAEGSLDDLAEIERFESSWPAPMSPSARLRRAVSDADLDIDRWRRTGDTSRLDRAIALLAEQESRASPWQRSRLVGLHATALLDRAELAAGGEPLDDVQRAAVLLEATTPLGDRLQWECAITSDQARATWLRGAAAADAAAIGSAVSIMREVLAKEPPASPRRPRHLRTLGAACESLFAVTGERELLRQALASFDEALAHPAARSVVTTDILGRRDRLRAELDGPSG